MPRRIAIIPARGGSKRIPHKNIKSFNGKPMIAYILSAARESGLFDIIHVSTEDPQISDTVEALGFSVDFMRPSHLADDFTPIMPVLKYVADTYAERGENFDQVWLLMACAPLIDATDLKAAAQLFEQKASRFPVIAVAEYPVPIEWAFNRASDGRLTPVQLGMFAVRSQDLEKKYFDAGVFSVLPILRVLDSEDAGSDSDFIGYTIPKTKAIDIDEEADWELAEAMYRIRERE
jgi:pseudaminic acid cytidylyltransferase